MLLEHLKQVNNFNTHKQFLVEKEMLDISIENADKIVTSDAKLKDFLNDTYIVKEKFDGTKLTLWRNDNDWDEDYEKNWVVAFKNQILYGAEFNSVDREKVKKYSVGISQYAFIHDHMKKIHKNTKSFPKNTEIFIEFIQNKLTTTRDYENKHGLYLIAHSPAKGEIEGGMLKTRATGFFQNKLDDYSKILELNLPPVVFEGRLSSESEITGSIKNEKLKASWLKNKKDYANNPYQTIKKTFLEFESSLGGTTEGVVLHNQNGMLFKFVQSDQYSKELRGTKKEKYQSDRAVENKYWETINTLSQNLLTELVYDYNKLDYKDILKQLSDTINTMNDSAIEKLFDFKFAEMIATNKIK